MHLPYCVITNNTLSHARSHPHANTVTGPCRYLYTEQPPISLDCNPYPVNVLRLSCAVDYSESELPVTLKWIYRPNSNSQTPVTITESDKYRINPSVTSDRIRSTLEIKTLTNRDAGSYSCQAEFTNGSRTDESQRLNLFTTAVYTNQQLPTCSQFQFRFSTTQKCADNTSSGGDNGGTEDGGDMLGLILAVVGVVGFLVITTFILVCCCIIFQSCKHFD